MCHNIYVTNWGKYQEQNFYGMGNLCGRNSLALESQT